MMIDYSHLWEAVVLILAMRTDSHLLAAVALILATLADSPLLAAVVPAPAMVTY
jgi:hypothetical protein